MLSFESERGSYQANKALYHQGRASQQNHGERDLCDHKRTTQLLACPPGTCTALSQIRGVAKQGGGDQARRNDSEEKRAQNRNGDCKAENRNTKGHGLPPRCGSSKVPAQQGFKSLRSP